MVIIAYKDRYYNGRIWVKDKRKAITYSSPKKAWRVVDNEINKYDEDIYLVGTKDK